MTSSKWAIEPARVDPYQALDTGQPSRQATTASKIHKAKQSKKADRDKRQREEILFNLGYSFRDTRTGASARRKQARVREDGDTMTSAVLAIPASISIPAPALSPLVMHLPTPSPMLGPAQNLASGSCTFPVAVRQNALLDDDESSITLVDVDPSQRWEMDRQRGVPLEERVTRHHQRTVESHVPGVSQRTRLFSQAPKRSPTSQSRFANSRLSLRIPEDQDPYSDNRSVQAASDISSPVTPKHKLPLPHIPLSPSRIFHRSQSPQPSSSVISLLRNPSPFFKSTPSLLDLSSSSALHSGHGVHHFSRKLFHRKQKERASTEPLEDWEVLVRTDSSHSSLDNSSCSSLDNSYHSSLDVSPAHYSPPSPTSTSSSGFAETCRYPDVFTEDTRISTMNRHPYRPSVRTVPPAEERPQRPAPPPFVNRHVRWRTSSNLRGGHISASSATVRGILPSFSQQDVGVCEEPEGEEPERSSPPTRGITLKDSTPPPELHTPSYSPASASPRRHYVGRPLPQTPLSPSLTWLVGRAPDPTTSTTTTVLHHPKAIPKNLHVPEALLINLDDDSSDSPSNPSHTPLLPIRTPPLPNRTPPLPDNTPMIPYRTPPARTPPPLPIDYFEDDIDSDSITAGSPSPRGPLTPTSTTSISSSGFPFSPSTCIVTPLETEHITGPVGSLGDDPPYGNGSNYDVGIRGAQSSGRYFKSPACAGPSPHLRFHRACHITSQGPVTSTHGITLRDSPTLSSLSLSQPLVERSRTSSSQMGLGPHFVENKTGEPIDLLPHARKAFDVKKTSGMMAMTTLVSPEAQKVGYQFKQEFEKEVLEDIHLPRPSSTMDLQQPALQSYTHQFPPSSSHTDTLLPVRNDEAGDAPPEAMLQDISRYITKDEEYAVARGGFGDIWKCTYHKDQAPIKVAVKALHAYAADHHDAAKKKKKVKRMQHELKICASLEHANILPVFGYTTGFGLFIAIVSPWAENGNLSTYLAREGEALTLVRRFQILRDITAGLQYLHVNSVIHGDLNGPNVLINGDGTACVADFGLSLMYSEVIRASQASWTSTFKGNLRWMAPELLAEREDGSPVRPSKQSDIYSFGGIMLQVLTNKIPYYYSNDIAIMRYIVKLEKPSRSRYPEQPDKYWDLIEQCWSTDPQNRPSTEGIDEVIKNEFLSLSGSH